MDSTLNLPPILLKEETGVLLLSILLKSINQNWGNNDSHISKMILDYFKFLPLSQTHIDTITKFQQQGVPEWVLYQLAVVYNHPERSSFIINHIQQETNMPTEEIQAVQDLLLKTLAGFKMAVDASPLRQLFIGFHNRDTQERLAKMDELKSQLANCLDFFKPNLNQAEFIFTPSDPLFSDYIGYSLVMSKNQTIFLTHNPLTKTQIYQILRFLLQPIVKQITNSLNESQKQLIYQKTSGKLKQLYGPNIQDIILSEFLTIYYNQIRTNQPLESFNNFQARVHNLSDKEFLQSMEFNKSLRERCAYLGIKNLVEFKAGLKQYYELYFEDQLSQAIFKLYTHYKTQTQLNFEQFAIANFQQYLV